MHDSDLKHDERRLILTPSGPDSLFGDKLHEIRPRPLSVYSAVIKRLRPSERECSSTKSVVVLSACRFFGLPEFAMLHFGHISYSSSPGYFVSFSFF